MTPTKRSKREWRIFFWVLVVSAIASAWFGVRVAPPNEWWLRSASHGVFTCLTIAVPILLLQIKGERLMPIRRLRRLPLLAYVAIRTAFYVVVIVGGLLFSRWVLSDDFVHYVLFDKVFRQSLLFSVAMATVGNLFFEFGSLIGISTLRNLLTGRYVQPRAEQKTFLLIDMKNSTGLAERLGPIRFHELLSDFFRDISDAALDCEAEIHKYVGDEAILTWKGGATALGDGSALFCPFLARDIIARHKKMYLDRFGAVPDFRAALHCGEIVAGEIGDVRREIAYVGDTLNVAARLLDATKQLGHDTLVSNDLLQRAKVPSDLQAKELPMLAVRGRVAPLAIAALSRN
jgi:adenylate cyclase